MEKFIYDYLSKNYYIDTSEVGNDGIYSISDDRKFKTPHCGKKLTNELITVFNIAEEEAKLFIHLWSSNIKPDVDLEFYWQTLETLFENVAFPMVRRVFAQTLAMDLVPVVPLSMPNLDLVYLDFQYKEETLYEKVKNKIIEVMENIYYRILGLFKNN